MQETTNPRRLICLAGQKLASAIQSVKHQRSKKTSRCLILLEGRSYPALGFFNEILYSSDGGSSWLSEAESDPFCPKLSKKQRIFGFMGCIGMGILCFMMAAMYLPVLIISARKFALLYTLGSIFFISSFSLLYGPKKHFKVRRSSKCGIGLSQQVREKIKPQ